MSFCSLFNTRSVALSSPLRWFHFFLMSPDGNCIGGNYPESQNGRTWKKIVKHWPFCIFIPNKWTVAIKHMDLRIIWASSMVFQRTKHPVYLDECSPLLFYSTILCTHGPSKCLTRGETEPIFCGTHSQSFQLNSGCEHRSTYTMIHLHHVYIIYYDTIYHNKIYYNII